MSREEVFVTVGGSIIVAIVGAIAALLGKKQDMTGKAQSALNESFKNYTDATNKRLDDLEKAIKEKDKKITFLEGLIRDMSQHLKSLENILASHNIPIPIRPFKLNKEPPTVENVFKIEEGKISEFEDR